MRIGGSQFLHLPGVFHIFHEPFSIKLWQSILIFRRCAHYRSWRCNLKNSKQMEALVFWFFHVTLWVSHRFFSMLSLVMNMSTCMTQNDSSSEWSDSMSHDWKEQIQGNNFSLWDHEQDFLGQVSSFFLILHSATTAKVVPKCNALKLRGFESEQDM